MRMVDLIIKKRGGGTLNREEIDFIVSGYTSGSIPEYQISAWLMAVFFKGMTFEETGTLTDAMLHSGDVIDLSDLAGPLVDKHSTGGVGDKISLILAPIAAACGVTVPMMSGRALGHTGGTLDKLESIRGYRTNLTQEEFRAGLRADGFAMMGQTERIAPADKLLYALRDVTGTVESVPLITASILSKKAAEGARSLVFDVKCGSGAFMKDVADARKLAESLTETGKTMGLRVASLITNMNEPLGNAVGNFLEIEETISCLDGRGPDDVMELTYALASRMLELGGKASNAEQARAMCEKAVTSGKAKELFLRNVAAQGGDARELLAQAGVRRSPYRTVLAAPCDCYIGAIDAMKTGLAGVYLGVGRAQACDAVCPDAGVVFYAKRGARVKKNDVVAELFGANEASLEPALELLKSAFKWSSEKPAAEPLIYETAE